MTINKDFEFEKERIYSSVLRTLELTQVTEWLIIIGKNHNKTDWKTERMRKLKTKNRRKQLYGNFKRQRDFADVIDIMVKEKLRKKMIPY